MELTQDPTLLWFIAIYGVIMVGIGIFMSKKVAGSEDFVLAGKSLGPFVLMGTLLATWTGSGSISGGETSMAFSYGILPSLMMMLPTLVGILILYVVAPKIREYGKFTVSGILEAKYGRASRNIASVIIILAYVGIVSYQMKGFGFILNLTTGMSVQSADHFPCDDRRTALCIPNRCNQWLFDGRWTHYYSTYDYCRSRWLG
ncbi:sodium:solute symporter family transporter [Halobacillus litoralis]|uniref:sodium:solute symporter family transporter n=1 Tax=Halobacillus litoralis TaxID=45668 RepID=UPI00296E2EEF|nr:hypothetical protein [Halobacillus litoralis]